ncbi:MAG: cellulase family glycosylhydrolase [Bacteroidales bacterium]|nr:cellulase family glycosylhydrolase [Bacteroidales bacterium]MBN2761993.1 cellulase family glycosylhydrolase [Bacteroidales bacterium]
MKMLWFLLLFLPVAGFGQAEMFSCKSVTVNSYEIYAPDVIQGICSDSITPDTTGMRDLTSVELSKEMIPGWNVGNSLEAIGGETEWGNPLITQRLIDSVKAAGFKAIRIPVAWSKYTDAVNFTIDTVWMNRVEEVVNYVLSDSLYAIINIHWDGGWMQPTYARQDYVNNRLAVMWHQIAVHFRDYDDRLLFAGTNEVMVDGDYGTPSHEYTAVQNSFNQTFVSTVRSTGGRNYYRHLVVQGFNTNINFTVSYFEIPDDAVENRLMVEVHYYDPYNFTLNTESGITQWGKYATDPLRTETWANESYADNQFLKMKTNFVNKGYGVILGEYGVISRTNLGSAELNAEYAVYRRYYIEYITQSIVKNELVPVYWDNGYTGNHAFGLFYRSSGAQAHPEMIQAIIRGCDTNHIISRIGQINNESFRIYPNPVRNSMIIEVFDKSVLYGQLFSLNGQLIEKLSLEYGINTFDISEIEAGLYFIVVFTSKGTIVQKVKKNN